jgi:hypothetical protein
MVGFGLKKGTLIQDKNVALPGIEPGSRASETLVLSIVLQGHGANINEQSRLPNICQIYSILKVKLRLHKL